MNATVQANGTSAQITLGNQRYSAVIGRGGVTANKQEGDNATPIGSFRILGVMYRPDKLAAPKSAFPARPLEVDDVWVDESADPRYNQPAKASEVAPGVSHEKLWREDHLYDVIVDLDYNRSPATPAKGSAIFMHLARDQENPANTPTAGCVGMKKANLLELLAALRPDDMIDIS